MKPEEPIYVSKGSFASLGNEYRIYSDRLELQSWFFFRTFVIPFDELISIDIFKPPVFRTSLWALKLDFADMFRHVGIERKNGFMKKLRFTPRNVEEFVERLREQS